MVPIIYCDPTTQPTLQSVIANDDNYGFGVGASGLYVRLFSNNFVPNQQTPLSAFVPAAFSGTFAADLSMLYGFGLNGVQQVRGANGVNFRCTSEPASPTVAYGYFAENLDSGLLVMSGVFRTPKVIHAGTIISLQVICNFAPMLALDDGTNQ
jgi:hypothetical protein